MGTAIDRFLDQIENLGAEVGRSREPLNLLPGLLIVAVTASAPTIVRRLRQRWLDDETEPSGDASAFGGFPGLPSPWGLEEI